MSAHVLTRRYITCDDKGCDKTSKFYASIRAARLDMKRRFGWSYLDGLDLCNHHTKVFLDQRIAEKRSA